MWESVGVRGMMSDEDVREWDEWAHPKLPTPRSMRRGDAMPSQRLGKPLVRLQAASGGEWVAVALLSPGQGGVSRAQA